MNKPEALLYRGVCHESSHNDKNRIISEVVFTNKLYLLVKLAFYFKTDDNTLECHIVSFLSCGTIIDQPAKKRKEMKKGFIDVSTENIFPIIKKFLYSDTEIFLRELISNSVDATTKLKKLVSMGKADVEFGDLTITVEHDKEKKELRIIDRGIGMTAEEVEKYITQIAFSGATDFIQKFSQNAESEQNHMIGHFGLGFYSAFMVSDKVEIFTRSYQNNTPAVHWTCEGNPEFTLEECEYADRGTTVVLHLSEDAEDFNDEHRILSILKKHCLFLPFPIRFGDETTYEPVNPDDKENKETKEIKVPRIINNPDPLWKKNPADLKDEDYENFYRELYPYSFDKPSFWIHINVDYPFNLSGILYFPELKKNIEANRNKIHLYCNQVFVTDNVEDIVPDFLTYLHGVIDSPDIPLNVSRSYLQSDSNVKKIRNHITKRVADKLEELYKNNREDFEAKWPGLRDFIRFGIISNDTFRDKAKVFALVADTTGKYFTVAEYKEKVKENQTDKNKKIIFLYASEANAQQSYIAAAEQKGYSVLLMDSILDNHYIDFVDRDDNDVDFRRVDSDTIDRLIAKEDVNVIAKLSDDEKTNVKTWFEQNISELKDARLTVEMKDLQESEMPVVMIQPEMMRRFRDMAGVGGMDFAKGMPGEYVLVVNANHPVVTNMVDSSDEEKRTRTIEHLIDLGLLSQGLLSGEKMTRFINRTIDIIK